MDSACRRSLEWSSETARAQRYENGTSGRFEHGPMLALVRKLPFENENEWEFPGSEGSGRHFTALKEWTSCFFTLPRVSEKQEGASLPKSCMVAERA
jgi:hypothetical protein